MHINDKGLELLKEFEGCKLKAYRDSVGVLTIGYGHTGPDVHDGMEINQPYADMLLKKDLEHFEQGVFECVDVPITPNRFSALVCFAYNVGLGNLKASTLLRKLNAGAIKDAALEFTRWDRAGGVHVAGLLRRREAERELFLSL